MTEVTKIDSRTVKTYTVHVKDGEVLTDPYSGAGRQFQVEVMTVVKQDGNVSSVELFGTVLKKDGTKGKNTTRRRVWGNDRPEFVKQILAGLA